MAKPIIQFQKLISMPNIKNAQLEESLAIENIFGKPPGWIIHWGITSATLFLLVCLCISTFIQYPDKLNATAVLTTANAPIKVISPTNDILTKLWVKDNQLVSKGDLLAILGEDGNWQQIFWLDSIITRGNHLNLELQQLELGSITSVFEDFKRTLKQERQNKNLDISQKQVYAIQQEIQKLEELSENLNNQKQLFKKELVNEKSNYVRSKQLLTEEVISQLDYEQVENRFLQQKRSYESMTSTILTNEIRVEQLQASILNIQKNNQEQKGNLTQDVEQKMSLLVNAIERWKEQYLIRAIIAGSYVLPFAIQEGAFISSGDLLGTIIPAIEHQKPIIRAILPTRGFGNLAIGQTALIELENYPANQYGVLKGQVSNISILPQNDNYEVILTLSNGWVTSYNKKIPQRQQLKAQVSIITKSYTLLDRVFQNILDVVANRN